MSSHHVIRENQEPALLIQDFKALDLESLGQLLEWSPTLVTDFQNLDCLLAEGIKVDVLFSNEEISSFQEHTKIVPFEGDFLKESLRYLIKNNHKAVNIMSSYIPEGLDDIAKDINIVLFNDRKRFLLALNSFEKWKPKGELVYVGEQYLKSFDGLTHLSKDTFQTTQDGFIRLEFNTSAFVLVGEEL